MPSFATLKAKIKMLLDTKFVKNVTWSQNYQENEKS